MHFQNYDPGEITKLRNIYQYQAFISKISINNLAHLCNLCEPHGLMADELGNSESSELHEMKNSDKFSCSFVNLDLN